jgi:hypothetical protein
MISVGIRHAFKCFYPGVHMFNNHPLPRKPFVERFLPFAQLMLLAPLFRYQAVRVQLFYAKIPKVGVYAYRSMDRFPNSVLIQLEIMLAAFAFLNVYYFHGFLLYDHLRFYRMTLFLA